MTDYKHNHYVPVSYQKRFMLPGQTRYYRLDLRPETVTRGTHKYTREDVKHWSPKRIFAEDELYTTRWGQISNREIEQFFFGRLDHSGPTAIDYICNFNHKNLQISESAFRQFVNYMSVQKLRTPKGIAAFAAYVKSYHKNATLLLLQEMQNMHCAVWTESVWQIADASELTNKVHHL